MKICISGSMQFVEKMLEVKNQLEKYGHTPYVSKFISELLGKNDEEIESIKLEQKMNQDAIREYWDILQEVDALLVLNYDKKEIKNYIGGNTLMEIGFAYVLNRKIFLLNDIPTIPYYQSEIEAIKPIILNCDLSKIK